MNSLFPLQAAILQADARAIPLRDQSVHCVVTSPPYWGLRDYGTAKWVGGDAGCDHLEPPRGGFNPVTSSKQAGHVGTHTYQYAHTCRKCGARRVDAQLGLESTPEEYLANMVAVFREVWRVLRDDGTAWVNMGDCYASSPPGNKTKGVSGASTLHGVSSDKYQETLSHSVQSRRNTLAPSLKPKDLVGMPWRLAFALQADGADMSACRAIERAIDVICDAYEDETPPDRVLHALERLHKEYEGAKGNSWYLRSDIIWSKPNPMPESVRDRPTKAHEYVFLLSKRGRYFYDADAVREDPQQYSRKGGSAAWTADSGHTNGIGSLTFHQMNPSGRNLRDVWHIATQPYPEAHFATYPEKLVEPCVKAGTSQRGVCEKCGAPWGRVVEREAMTVAPGQKGRVTRTQCSGTITKPPSSTTTGWTPSCTCDAGTVPAIVFDPFGGSGTTAAVALKLGRRAVAMDIGYHDLARRRVYGR